MNKAYSCCQALTISNDVSYGTTKIFERALQKCEIVSTTHQCVLCPQKNIKSFYSRN